MDLAFRSVSRVYEAHKVTCSLLKHPQHCRLATPLLKGFCDDITLLSHGLLPFFSFNALN